MPTRKAEKRIAFLDTNALLDLFEYWLMCQAFTLRLNTHSGITQLRRCLEGANATPPFPLKSQEMAALKRGLGLFHKMSARAGNWDLFTSQVCLSEMQHTLLEDRATERLIASKIPYRLRMERPLIVFRRSLTKQDYARLELEVADFFDQLSVDYGITVQTAEENATDLMTVAAIAEKVWSHVLLEVMDAFIYASAVTSMADVLITRDSPFRDAVNKLCRPPDSEWRSIRRSLDNALLTLQHGYAWPEGRSVKAPFPR